MGLSIEFYAADREGFVRLFASDETTTRYERMATYPVADFSLHLWIPDDMDSLCRALNKQNPDVPVVFRDMLIEQLWYDGQSESLTLVSDQLVRAVAGMNDNEIEQAGLEWASTFSNDQTLHQTAAFRSVQQLRQVAKGAIAQEKTLILRLLGDSRF